MGKSLTGSEILLESLTAEGVETIFGYPGGQIMPVYDKLYDYKNRLHHILVRHEQGAVHAAQGYARVKGKVGVVVVTSGPGATNVITGIADAMVDSTPIVVISGQVNNQMLGTDAFQETDVIGLTIPISKWNYQIRKAEEIDEIIAKAFYIASTGRPGPVVLEITKDAQVGIAEYKGHKKCDYIKSYVPKRKVEDFTIAEAASLINKAEKPLLIFGQGIAISGAEKELEAFIEKAGIPATSTLLGLSCIKNDNPHYIGMAGMHGNIASNMMTTECDLLIAVGMRFDDRVTGKTSEYASKAKVIHIDIDPAEINKIIHADIAIIGDAKEVLAKLTSAISNNRHDDWETEAKEFRKIEEEKVIAPEVRPADGTINMGEVVNMVADESDEKAIIVTDVGQNQMTGARYSRFKQSRSFISSGGLGTMGFGLPAAIGAKTAAPERPVCLFVGDGGLQMTIQELGTIMQEGTGVKIVLLNNNWLGNVRQWQELFFKERYSETLMLNPDYKLLASAYGIGYRHVEERAELQDAVKEMLSDDKPFLLEVHVTEMGMVFPMVAPGKPLGKILLSTTETLEK